MLSVTTAINEDEPVWSLAERNLPSPNGKELRRYQIIIVRRDDRPSEWREDLGAASDFKKGEFRVQSYWYESVGQAREIADYLRTQPDWRDKIIPVNIVDEYKIEQEKRKLLAQGKSTFGFGGRVIR